MKTFALVALSLLALAACSPASQAPATSAAPGPVAPDAPPPAQSAAPPAAPAPTDAPAAAAAVAFPRLEELVRPDDTLADLQARLGPASVVAEVLPGPEGESTPAWVLYPDHPTRRLDVYLDATGERPESIVAGAAATDWVRGDGVRVGLELAGLAALNGRSFVMSGFGWDYGGTVLDWNGGAIAPDGRQAGFVRLCAPASSDALGHDQYPMGEAGVDSDLPVLRDHPPSVCQFTLAIGTPP
jgi:hypothetical protein